MLLQHIRNYWALSFFKFPLEYRSQKNDLMISFIHSIYKKKIQSHPRHTIHAVGPEQTKSDIKFILSRFFYIQLTDCENKQAVLNHACINPPVFQLATVLTVIALGSFSLGTTILDSKGPSQAEEMLSRTPVQHMIF